MPLVPYLSVQQRDKIFYLTRLSAGLLTRITYAAVRGQDNEVGAVQRLLNPRRIASIKEFTLAGGDYPSVVILNWLTAVAPLNFEGDTVDIPEVERVAQLIDGQHRVAGLRAAIEERQELAELQMPVAIYRDLDTRQCANIFLSINTEQKPVARSLVFDLYGIADDQIVDPAATRARDIALSLNEEGSPFHDNIKLPGGARRKGGIQLSTVVTAIKPLVEEKGDLEQIGLRELEMQKQVLLNYFTSLREKYGAKWTDTSNAFMYAAGFMGAIDFFRHKLIPYANARKSFKKDVISAAINLDPQGLILQEEVKGKGGKDAPKIIFDRLVEAFAPQGEQANAIEI